MTPEQALLRVIHCLDRAHESGFKAKAFARALDVVRSTPTDELAERAHAGTLTDLDGIGSSTATVIADALAGREPAYLAKIEAESQVSITPEGQVYRDALRGDCHLHSTWSDGGAPIEAMAATAMDWPLIVAMMYRESRFDPDVVSWAGARGLMQVLPTTAQRFGISDIDSAEGSIVAGVRMLGWLYAQMDSELTVPDRTWFSLAAYNAGLGHLLDARKLARELGLDPNRWFGNVEHAMLKLSLPEHYRNARHGYVRGIEPVTYVRDVRALYNAYRSMVKS